MSWLELFDWRIFFFSPHNSPQISGRGCYSKRFLWLRFHRSSQNSSWLHSIFKNELSTFLGRFLVLPRCAYISGQCEWPFIYLSFWMFNSIIQLQSYSVVKNECLWNVGAHSQGYPSCDHSLREDWSTRFQIIEELRAVVQSVESLRGTYAKLDSHSILLL